MEAEKASPDKGKQDLPPEGAATHKRSAADHDSVAMPAEQQEEERPPEEPAPIPQMCALRGHKHFLAEEPRARRASVRGRGADASCSS